MLSTLLYDPIDQNHSEGREELIAAWSANPDSLIWVDFYDENPSSESETMKPVFGLHPLAVSDAQRSRHPAKIEQFDSYSFLLLKSLDAQTTTIAFNTIQIAIFIGPRFLLTRHNGISVSIGRLWDEVRDGGQLLMHRPVGIVVLLLWLFKRGQMDVRIYRCDRIAAIRFAA